MKSNEPRARMVDLGGTLRKAREEKGISLAEAEAATRIKGRYLGALEENDWASVPTPVQARGFLRNYAAFLDMDEEEVLSWYGQLTRSGGVSLPTPAAADSPVPTTGEDGAVFRPRNIDINRAPAVPNWVSSDVIIGVVLALVVALVGFAVLRFVSRDSNDDPEAGATTPGTSSVEDEGDLPTSSEPAVSPTVGTPVSLTPTFDASIGRVQLNLEATEHVWVRVTVDGDQVLEGILVPSVPQTWQGAQQIVLETANGAGLDATVNGQPQGPLGERGQAITLAWGPNGFIALTPTPLP